MQVLYHYDAGPRLRSRFDELRAQGLHIECCSEQDDDTLFELLPSTEVLWHCLRPVDRDVLDAAPNLRLVQKIGVGLNTIDLDHAGTRGIAVCNMPGTNSRAVAEHTLMLMLAALRRLTAFDRYTRAHHGWSRPAEIEDGLGELAGRTVGLVGHGSVPKILGPILWAMGASVLYTARSQDPDAVGAWRALDDLLAEADIVSLHVPLTDETHHLLDAARMAKMKRGAILVNTARGALVEAAALDAALASGHIGAAALDVFATEPVAEAPGHADRLIVTPHVAWLTQETLERSLAVAVENCQRLVRGDELLYRVA